MAMRIIFGLLLSTNVMAFTNLDSFLDDFIKEREKMFEQMDSMMQNSSSVELTEVRKDNGDLEVTITPKSKDVNFNVDEIQNGTGLVIKTETKVSEEVTENGQTSKSFSSSSSSQSILRPGYKIAGKPVRKGDSITYTFSPNTKEVKKRSIFSDPAERRPIGRIPGEDTI